MNTSQVEHGLEEHKETANVCVITESSLMRHVEKRFMVPAIQITNFAGNPRK
jgi:hypothetical protein